MWIRGLTVGAILAGFWALTAPVGAGAPPPADVPATAVFADAPGLAIKGDGGDYVHGEDCVRSYYQTRKGNYLLRFPSGTILCTPGDPGYGVRTLNLDFSDFIGQAPNGCDPVSGPYDATPIDPCGPNVVLDVRLGADTMFSSSATPFTLSFDPEPNALEHSVQFQLTFDDPLPVTTDLEGTREVTDEGITATLSVLTVQGRKVKYVVVGTYNMPFALTVTPQ